jgi:DNA-binding transcriptional LysR family regulator
VITSTLLNGHAAGPVQQLLVNHELSEGRLIRILPEYEVKPTEAFLAYPSVRFMRPVVRAFTDFVIPELRSVEGIVGRGETQSSEKEERPDPLANAYA